MGKNNHYSKGELVDGVRDAMRDAKEGTNINISVSDKKRVPIPPNVMVFQTFAYLAATKMTPAANRILMLFLAISQYEGGVSMDVETIKDELGIKTKKTVITALNQLEAEGILIKVPYLKDKRRHEYYINPIAAWKGNGAGRREFLRKTDPDQLKLFSVDVAEHVAREHREMKAKRPLLDKWDAIEQNAIEAAKDASDWE